MTSLEKTTLEYWPFPFSMKLGEEYRFHEESDADFSAAKKAYSSCDVEIGSSPWERTEQLKAHKVAFLKDRFKDRFAISTFEQVAVVRVFGDMPAGLVVKRGCPYGEATHLALEAYKALSATSRTQQRDMALIAASNGYVLAFGQDSVEVKGKLEPIIAYHEALREFDASSADRVLAALPTRAQIRSIAQQMKSGTAGAA